MNTFPRAELKAGFVSREWTTAMTPSGQASGGPDVTLLLWSNGVFPFTAIVLAVM